MVPLSSIPLPRPRTAHLYPMWHPPRSSPRVGISLSSSKFSQAGASTPSKKLPSEAMATVVTGSVSVDGSTRRNQAKKAMCPSRLFPTKALESSLYVLALTCGNSCLISSQQSTSIDFKHYGPTNEEALALATTLSDDHVAFLSEFLNPVYLQPRTMQALSARFVEESSLELHQFLNAPLSQTLQPRLREMDAKDGLGPDRPFAVPSHNAGTASPSSTPSTDRTSYFGQRSLSLGRTKTPPTNTSCPNSNWIVRGPPHKWRYCTLTPKPHHKLEAVTPRSAHVSPDEIMRSLQDELFPSDAFRAWLAIVAGLVPVGWICEARRFRPGLDYTLATSEAVEARLDVVLGLTPEISDAKGSRGHSKDTNWQGSEWGGWEARLIFTVTSHLLY